MPTIINVYQFETEKGNTFTTTTHGWTGKLVAKFRCRLKVKPNKKGIVYYIPKHKKY